MAGLTTVPSLFIKPGAYCIGSAIGADIDELKLNVNVYLCLGYSCGRRKGFENVATAYVIRFKMSGGEDIEWHYKSPEDMRKDELRVGKLVFLI